MAQDRIVIPNECEGSKISPYSRNDRDDAVGADLRVGPPNGRTHRSAPTIARCLLHRITLSARASTLGATTPHIANVRPMAKIPPHFGFWILDFRLPD